MADDPLRINPAKLTEGEKVLVKLAQALATNSAVLTNLQGTLADLIEELRRQRQG